jgi:hypothetical protein
MPRCAAPDSLQTMHATGHAADAPDTAAGHASQVVHMHAQPASQGVQCMYTPACSQLVLFPRACLRAHVILIPELKPHRTHEQTVGR